MKKRFAEINNMRINAPTEIRSAIQTINHNYSHDSTRLNVYDVVNLDGQDYESILKIAVIYGNKYTSETSRYYSYNMDTGAETNLHNIENLIAYIWEADND